MKEVAKNVYPELVLKIQSASSDTMRYHSVLGRRRYNSTLPCIVNVGAIENIIVILGLAGHAEIIWQTVAGMIDI